MDELVRTPPVAALAARQGAAAVTDAARTVLDRLRDEISSGLLDEPALNVALSGIAGAIEEQLRRAHRFSLRSVINATGVILHTNLGRAPMAGAAIDHIRETAATYSNLEFDVEVGERGTRDIHVERLFQQLLRDDELADYSSDNSGEGPSKSTEVRSAGRPGAPVPTLTPASTRALVPTRADVSTIVVNNNAAAVLLVLNTLAEGGEVIVSRGELVEIGGSFRIPDVMAKSGAILREVGTTNRTRIADYAHAVSERTRLLLRVHRSNFAITGFTEQASTAELVELARKHGLPLVEDLGSGALVELQSIGVSGEPTVLDSMRAGVDVVTYSGDKLLGGPQAGLISGRRELVARIRSNSLFRALRVDKLTYAALEATLMAYVKRDHNAIPTLQMMRLTRDEIDRRAEKLAAQIKSSTLPSRLQVEVIDGESVIGGGAAPSSVLPSRPLALTCSDLSADELASRLRENDPPIIARIEEGRVLLDLRTVFQAQDAALAAAVQRIAA